MNLFALRLAAAASFFAFTGVGTARASWLTIQNPPVSNEINLGVGNSQTLFFPGMGGTASVALLTAGGTGAFLLRSYPFFPSGNFSEYAANGLDPNGSDQYGIVGFGGSGATTSVRFDFSGLAGGVLPAGSIFTVFDLDVFESLTNLRAFGPGNSPLTTAWLQFVRQFDANGSASGSGLNATNSFHFATSLFAGGAYQFTSPSVNPDIPTLYFITTQDIASITFDGAADFGPRGYGVAFAINDVPEPSTFALSAATLILAGLYRRRQMRRES